MLHQFLPSYHDINPMAYDPCILVLEYICYVGVLIYLSNFLFPREDDTGTKIVLYCSAFEDNIFLLFVFEISEHWKRANFGWLPFPKQNKPFLNWIRSQKSAFFLSLLKKYNDTLTIIVLPLNLQNDPKLIRLEEK